PMGIDKNTAFDTWRSTMTLRALRSTAFVLTLAAAPVFAQPGSAPAAQSRSADAQRPSDAAPGQTFKECRNCPEMIVLPAGTFTMGSLPEDPMRRDNERQQEITFTRPFAMATTPVTWNQWE